MVQNIGKTDRIFRLCIGVILLSLAFWIKSGFLAIFGLFALYEAVAGWCIFYKLIGKNSCKITNHNSNIHLLNTFIAGIVILIGAIILNLILQILEYYSWYDLFRNSKEVMAQAKIDNLIFLFFVYPFVLGYLAIAVKILKFKR